MLTQKEMQRRLTVETPYLRLFLGDMKIVIPTLVAVGLIIKNSLKKYTQQTTYRLVVLAFAGYAAFKLGVAVAEWRTGYIIGYLEGFDLGTMKVSTF
tara:strand:- start:1123 stop:1413 length:291 start_codon:yes stop_codon:yes gene_type:complete